LAETRNRPQILRARHFQKDIARRAPVGDPFNRNDARLAATVNFGIGQPRRNRNASGGEARKSPAAKKRRFRPAPVRRGENAGAKVRRRLRVPSDQRQQAIQPLASATKFSKGRRTPGATSKMRKKLDRGLLPERGV